MRTWKSPDGVNWVVDVDLPGSSNAMLIFRHPGATNGRLDRYSWFISRGPEARSVTSRISTSKVIDALSDEDIARYFRRSMRISRPDPLLPAQASNG